jgi:hypothetical protein
MEELRKPRFSTEKWGFLFTNKQSPIETTPQPKQVVERRPL